MNEQGNIFSQLIQLKNNREESLQNSEGQNSVNHSQADLDRLLNEKEEVYKLYRTLDSEINSILKDSSLENTEANNESNQNSLVEEPELASLLTQREKDLVYLNDVLTREKEFRKLEALRYEKKVSDFESYSQEKEREIISLNADLAKKEQELAKLREVLNSEQIAREKDRKKFKLEKKNLENELKAIKKRIAKLQKGFKILFESKRWKIANFIGNLQNALMFRRKSPSPRDFIEKNLFRFDRKEKNGKLVIVGYFLKKHNVITELKEAKFKFWLGDYNKIKSMFSKCIVLEHSKKKRLEYDSKKWETYYTPKFLYHSEWSFKKLMQGTLAFIPLVFNHRKALLYAVRWEKSIIKSFDLTIRGKLGARVKMICGIGEITHRAKMLDLKSNDVLVIHAISPVNEILCSIAKKANSKIVFTEFGELPLTCFVSEEESIHNTWPLLESERFTNLPITQVDVEEGAKVINNMATSRQSSRPGEKTESTVLPELKGQTVIYVNGIYPFASGLEPRKSEKSKVLSPYYATNQELLDSVGKIAERNGWHVVYKDHPLTTKIHPNSVVKSSKYKNVHILTHEDIHEILDVADVTVSLASKSILVSLARGVPVCLAGPYTIPKGAISPGVAETENLEEGIKSLLVNKAGERVNIDDFNNYIARLRKYYLYPYVAKSKEAGMKNPSDIWKDLQEFISGQRRRISISDQELENKVRDVSVKEKQKAM
jgi:hypothetical protein